MCGLHLLWYNHYVIDQSARYTYPLWRKRSSGSKLFYLSDDYAATVTRGKSLIKSAQIGGFMFCGNVA